MPRPSLSERRRGALSLVEQDLRSADLTGRGDQCPRCRGVKAPSFAQCRLCNDLAFASASVPVGFGTLVAQPSPLYSWFKYYKNVRGENGERYRDAIAAIVSGAYEQHGPAIELALGAAPDLVTTVPSTRVVHATQPLQSALQRVAQLAAHCEDVLEHTGLARVQRTVQADLFRTSGSLKGRRVVLVEDLWVGGTTVESAIHAPVLPPKALVTASTPAPTPGLLANSAIADSPQASTEPPQWSAARRQDESRSGSLRRPEAGRLRG